jgi:hypothetical protein
MICIWDSKIEGKNEIYSIYDGRFLVANLERGIAPERELFAPDEKLEDRKAYGISPVFISLENHGAGSLLSDPESHRSIGSPCKWGSRNAPLAVN